MRAIEITEPRKLTEIKISAPSPPVGNEVLVKTHSVGICGTDASSYLGKFPFFDYPRIPGHELGVEVMAIGEKVTKVKVGDRCSVEPYMQCGDCYACRKGTTNCCEKMNVIGVMSDGGLCEQFLINEDKLHPSSLLSYEQLALVETLAIGCHAVNRLGLNQEDHVLIIGVGPIGLSALEFVKLTGAKITVMDMMEQRIEFCNKHYTIDSCITVSPDKDLIGEVQKLTNGDRFSAVIDATGNSRSMASALSYVAQAGRLLYLGVTTDNIIFPHPMLHRPEVTLMASRNALSEEFVQIIAFLEEGEIDTKPWITHRLAFDDVVEKFESVIDPSANTLKAIISL